MGIRRHPICFIDIDGVICLERPHGPQAMYDAAHGLRIDADQVFDEGFHRPALEQLAAIAGILELRFVISSSWRHSFDRQRLEDLLCRSRAGFIADRLADFGKLAWSTARSKTFSSRSLEVADWLRSYRQHVHSWAAIDDPHSGASLRRFQLSQRHPDPAARVILCDPTVGLTATDAQHVKTALMTPL